MKREAIETYLKMLSANIASAAMFNINIRKKAKKKRGIDFLIVFFGWLLADNQFPPWEKQLQK